VAHPCWASGACCKTAQSVVSAWESMSTAKLSAATDLATHKLYLGLRYIRQGFIMGVIVRVMGITALGIQGLCRTDSIVLNVPFGYSWLGFHGCVNAELCWGEHACLLVDTIQPDFIHSSHVALS